MPSPSNTNQYGVHFGNNTEYPIFTNEPPVVVPGRYDVPRTPLLTARSLPGSPAVQGQALHPERDSSRDSGHAWDNGSVDARSSTSPLSPKPSSPALSPNQTSDLCPELQRFPVQWLVRQTRLANLPRSACFSAYAFVSRRKTCVLHFRGVHESDEWDVAVGPLDEGRSLRVKDILTKIDEELYKLDDASGMYKGHPRYDDACRERVYRLNGREDERARMFRGIDFYSERFHRYFVGLTEMPDAEPRGAHFFVHFAPHAQAA